MLQTLNDYTDFVINLLVKNELLPLLILIVKKKVNLVEYGEVKKKKKQSDFIQTRNTIF